MFISVYPRCGTLFSHVYAFLSTSNPFTMFYPVYPLFIPFTHVLPRLPMFTPSYPRFTRFIDVYLCLSLIKRFIPFTQIILLFLNKWHALKRAYYMQANRLTLALASIFWRREKSRKAWHAWNDSSVFVYQGAEALFRNRRMPLYPHVSQNIVNTRLKRFFRPASRNVLLLAQFLKAYLRWLCINRVVFLLSMLCMLLGNSFEPRSNSRVPNSTAGPVMITCLSINGRFCNRKTSLTRENKIDLFRSLGSKD